jgi:hypothetical protein
MEEKTVVAGDHGPVPMEDNGRRYIDKEPVTIKVTAYYARRLMSGELVEAPEGLVRSKRALADVEAHRHHHDEGK